jgi:hypothetical protein
MGNASISLLWNYFIKFKWENDWGNVKLSGTIQLSLMKKHAYSVLIFDQGMMAVFLIQNTN